MKKMVFFTQRSISIHDGMPFYGQGLETHATICDTSPESPEEVDRWLTARGFGRVSNIITSLGGYPTAILACPLAPVADIEELNL